MREMCFYKEIYVKFKHIWQFPEIVNKIMFKKCFSFEIYLLLEKSVYIKDIAIHSSNQVT